MNIEGTLLEKYETQIVTDSFRKREFVVEYAENPQYPEYLKFELIQSNCDQLDDFEPGQKMTISFNLKGRKWTDPKGEVKYFNSLQAWRLESNSQMQGAPSPTEEPDTNWMKEDFSEDDDLPF